ncbi:MAG: hypothetical protein HDT16_12980 [Oscillibacter sp.]|nr:hypothetical protein [Oscillibacter sp.]
MLVRILSVYAAGVSSAGASSTGASAIFSEEGLFYSASSCIWMQDFAALLQDKEKNIANFGEAKMGRRTVKTLTFFVFLPKNSRYPSEIKAELGPIL